MVFNPPLDISPFSTRPTGTLGGDIRRRRPPRRKLTVEDAKLQQNLNEAKELVLGGHKFCNKL